MARTQHSVPAPSAPVAHAPARALPARPAPGRPAGAAERAAPTTAAAARRAQGRPAARPVRRVGVAAGRPVRGGGCSGGSGTRWRARAVPGAAPAPPVPVRLTRRGRRVVAGLSMTIGVLVGVVTVSVELGGAGGLEPAGAPVVVVQPGDTLWSLAQDLAPHEDPRAVVDAIVDLNDLEGVGLVPGQRLELP
jgi:hypothetical protein